jgi:ribosome maturation factor RimP
MRISLLPWTGCVVSFSISWAHGTGAFRPFFVLFFGGRSVNLTNLELRLTEMLAPAVEALEFELLGIEFIRAGNHSTLRIYIDHENGITVDNCADVSHQVSAILDVEDPIATEYALEVSSPGMDRPLFTLPHFEAVIGETVNVKLNVPQDGRRNFKGTLVGIEGDMINVEVDNQVYSLLIDNVAKANLVARFD